MIPGFFILEAPTRFELVMEVLQTSALPLGDGAGCPTGANKYQRSRSLSREKQSGIFYRSSFLSVPFHRIRQNKNPDFSFRITVSGFPGENLPIDRVAGIHILRQGEPFSDRNPHHGL